ncbi:class I SAM-dependent methyltransferase [Aristophania vespae]|nr:methyltransferase domain-containing protein [Aristophania vespae]
MQGLHEKAFAQANQDSDESFFTQYGSDSLMDMGAQTAVTALYRTALPVGGCTLDLMAGGSSHMPEDASFQELIGVDVNKKALEQNKTLSRSIVQNLNEKTVLPFEDNYFDGAVMCDGIAYLTQPQKILEEVVRVLKAGAPFIVSFSDQFISAKAVAIWQALEPEDRIRLVTSLMHSAGFVEIDTGDVVPPEDLTAWKDSVHAIIGRVPQTL